MPSANTSPARSRCTDIVGAFEATGLHVATAGNLCALRFYSPTGTRIVRISLAAFIEAARGSHDGNGHPFPKLAGRAARERQLEEDAAAMAAATDRRTPPVVVAPPAVVEESPVAAPEPVKLLTALDRLLALPQLPRAEHRAERQAVLRQAWELYIASPSLNYGDFGRQLGCAPSFLCRTFEAFAQLPGAPVLKPNGKL